MTTPNVEIVMPYGVTVVGDGTNNPKLATSHPKQLQNFGLKLPPGPCRIAASWEGEENVGIVVQTNGTRNYRTVGNIPERSGGGVPVRAWSQSGPSRTTTCTSTDTNFRRARKALSRFTRSTSSSAPRRGGGVGGGGGFRESAGDSVLRPHRGQHRGYSDWRRFVHRIAGRCVYAVDYGARHRFYGSLVHLLVGCSAVRDSGCESRGHTGAVECVRTSRRETLFSDCFRFLRRRRSDDRYLPAVATGGGALNDHPGNQLFRLHDGAGCGQGPRRSRGHGQGVHSATSRALHTDGLVRRATEGAPVSGICDSSKAHGGGDGREERRGEVRCETGRLGGAVHHSDPYAGGRGAGLPSHCRNHQRAAGSVAQGVVA